MKNKKTKENTEEITILGIETSCDDTCAAVVKNGNIILSSIIASQHEIHAKYGGVVPELASRKHVEIIDKIIREALLVAGLSLKDINAIAVTNRPGLIGSLLVGAGTAKAISFARKIPLIAINHLKAHIFSNLLDEPEIKGDFIGLIISGGHSSIYHADKDMDITEVGHTVDDAAGEAFDKISRFLNLGYPGGPVIDRLSKKGDPSKIDLPRPMIDSDDFNFSFSGLKTALIYKTKKEPFLLKEENIYDLVAGFQQAIIDVIVHKTIKACREFGCDRILVSGGVAANSGLRKKFMEASIKEGLDIKIPPLSLCMDNAVMVAALGHHELINENFADDDMDVYSRSDI